MAGDSEEWTELRRRLLEFERADFALRRAARRLAGRDEDPVKALRDVLKHGPASWEPRQLSRPEEEAIAAHSKASACLTRVRAWLAARGVVVVPRQLGLRKSNPVLATALAKIRGDKEAFVSAVGCFGIGPDFPDGLPEEADIDEWFRTLTSLHTSECAERWLEAGALLVSSPLPDHVANALQNLRQVYSLGHPEATLAFCRTVAEAAAHQWLLENGHISRAEPDWARDADRLRELRPDLTPLLADIAVVRRRANEILHANRRSRSANEQEAYAGMRTTFRLVECLHQTD